jgi:outer membrane protein TolC
MNPISFFQKLALCILLATPTALSAQTILTLEEAYRLAPENSAIAGNEVLLETASELRSENINTSKMPSLDLKGRASWQNEVFGLPVDFPGVDFSVPHTNVQLSLEAGYLLYDGGLREARLALERSRLEVDRQQLQTELYALREKVEKAYFGALLIQEQQKLVELTRKDIAAKAEQLESAVRNGVALESDLKKLQVELLKIDATLEALESDRRAALAVLASLTGLEQGETPTLQLPVFDENLEAEWRRPELALFDLQQQQLHAANDLTAAGRRPKLSLFAQTGLGYPDPLNFFDDEVSPFFIGGLQFSWKIWDWGQADREYQERSVQMLLLRNRRKAFEQGLEHQRGRFAEEINKWKAQMAAAEKIAQMEADILKQVSAQLDNGTATATDYLLQSNAELKARLNMELYRIQLAQTLAAWHTWAGE